MDADQRVQHIAEAKSPIAAARIRTVAEGASVVLLRPRRLRGTIGFARRRVPNGWEVEIRSAEGTPLHLTLPERSLYVR